MQPIHYGELPKHTRGNTGVAAMMDAIAPPWRTDYPNNSLPLRYGNGNEQVLSGGTNGGQVPVMGTLTFAASGNSVASATGVFSFYILKV